MVAIQVYTLRMNISKPDSDFAKNTSAVMINKLARRIIMNDRNKKTEKKNSVDLTSVISTAIQVPGVKVNRDSFLREQFKNLSPNDLTRIIEIGPIEAGYSRNDLKKKANRIIKERTAISTSASFVAGLPGGLAMAATIPADMIQFYGVALRMAQELVYLYGEEDLWCDGTPDGDKVTNQLILYCGVMLGASGAAQTVRVMSSALAKQILKKLPQKALTKTIYYPVIKTILKFFGVSVTKTTFAKGLSKVVPVVGGVVSGGITLASMMPMGNRLVETLDKAHFDYSEADFNANMKVIEEVINDAEVVDVEATVSDAVQDDTESDKRAVLDKIKEAKKMLDDGILTEKEFSEIKRKFIVEM